MANQKASVVIMPGSFTTPPFYDPLVNTLRGQGFDAKAIPLLTANDGSVQPAPTADDDAAHIRQTVTSILDDASNPQDVVLALHSYSGIPGSSALEGLGRAARTAQGKHTAAVGVVYMASFCLPRGQDSRSFLGAHGAMPEAGRVGNPGGYLPPINPSYLPSIFNDVESGDDVARWAGMMTRHSSDSLDGAVRYEAWKEIPSVLIIPEKDLVVPAKLQEEMYEDAVAAGGKVTKVFVEGAGHSVPATRPELVAAEIAKLAVV